jgi:hypothetical protein
VLAKEWNVFPAVADGREDDAGPFCGGGMYVFLEFHSVLVFEVFAEHGVGESDRYADLVGL